MAIEGAVSNSPWETLGVVLEILRLVSSGWMTSETVVSGFPGGLVMVGIAELASVSVRVTSEAAVSDLYIEPVTVEKLCWSVPQNWQPVRSLSLIQQVRQL